MYSRPDPPIASGVPRWLDRAGGLG